MSERFEPSAYEVPASDALIAFMREGWQDSDDTVERLPVARTG